MLAGEQGQDVEKWDYYLFQGKGCWWKEENQPSWGLELGLLSLAEGMNTCMCVWWMVIVVWEHVFPL